MPTETTQRDATERTESPRGHQIVDEATKRVPETETQTDGDRRGRFRNFIARLGVVGVVGLFGGVVGLLGGAAALSLNLFDINDRLLPCDFLWKDACPLEQQVEVTNYNGADEWVELTNTGGDPVDLARWEIRDQAGHTYQFMDFVLEPGASVVLHTGAGDDTVTDVYWGRDDNVWNNDTELVVIVDADGQEVDSYNN